MMEALLKIKAMVTGEEGLTSMAKSLGGLKKGAENASGGLKSMLTSAGGLSGALGSLVPLVSGVGLAAMAKGAIDAADNMNDLSQKTGVSVERLSQFDQAAKMSGTTLEAVGGAMVKLARGMVSAGTATDEYGQTAEEALQQATQAVEDGEDRQIQAVQDAADKRLAALEKESDDRLKEINKRYRAEQQLLDDKYDDEAQRETEAAKDRQQQEERAIKKQFDARRKAIQDDKNLSDEKKAQLLESLREQEDEALKTLDRGYQKQQKERTRQFRDAQQQQENALDERKRAEESKIKERLNTEKTLTKDHTDSQVKQIKESTKEQLASLKDLAEGPKGVAKALQSLGISMTDATGKMKSTDEVMLEVADRFQTMPDGAQKSALAIQLFGKSGADMIPLLNGGRKAVESLSVTMTGKFAKGADEVNDKMVSLQTKLVELSVKLGTALMPVLMRLTDVLVGMADGFAAMPGWLQGTIAGVAGLLLVLPTLVSTLSGLIGIVKVISGLKLAATIASWAAAAGPAMGVISAAFTGLLTFLTGTLLPALLAFFSGPVGWTVLAVAAVVAMAIAFRKPLSQFITWLGSVFKKGWDGFVDNILKKPLTAYFKWWRKNWDTAKDIVGNIFKAMVGLVKAPMEGIATVIRNTLRLVFRNLENAFNGFVLKYNNLIAKLRGSAFGGLLGLLPTIPLLNLPKFAQGAYVNKPTAAIIGEAGPEYVIPAAQMESINKMYASRLKDMLDLNERQYQDRLARGGGSAAVKADADAQLANANRDAQMKTDMAKAQKMSDMQREGNRMLQLERLNQSAVQQPVLASNPMITWQPTQADRQAEQAKVDEWMSVQRDKMGDLLNIGFNTLINATASAVEASDVNVDIVQDVKAVVNIVTGPVLRFNDEDYVKIDDLRSAMQATAKGVFDSLRNPSTRIALGLV